MERLRLKNFDAKKVAPNFFEFLSQRGQVEVHEETEPVSRAGMAKGEMLHEGLAKPVYLNGKRIGQIEAYIDPPAVVYQGKLPDVPEPKRRGNRSRQPIIYEDGTAWTNVSISYHGEHEKAEKSGRNDEWTTIPLP